MTIRAKQGGEIAPNGEFYKGGQFINTIAQNPKSPTIARAAKPRKKEIAPYEWVLVDSSKKVIYTLIADCCRIRKVNGQWKTDRATLNHGYLNYCKKDIEWFTRLADLFDSGERYID
jgi:hypothetical protein